MTNDYQEQIRELILKNGPMGVNAIQKEIGIPLSSMQKYLEKQIYFVKTPQRKWDLPENVARVQLKDNTSNYETVIESQLNGINAMFEMLSNQIKGTITLLSAQKNTTLPVANNRSNVDERLVKVNNDSIKLYDIFKKQKHHIPEVYQDVLFNLDIIGLVLEMGTSYANKWFEEELYGLLSGRDQELPEEVLQILKEHQK